MLVIPVNSLGPDIYAIARLPKKLSIQSAFEKRDFSVWIAVYIAPNRRVATILKQFLEIEGILVKLKETKSPVQPENNVEIMVPELEIEEATEVINNALQRF